MKLILCLLTIVNWDVISRTENGEKEEGTKQSFEVLTQESREFSSPDPECVVDINFLSSLMERIESVSLFINDSFLCIVCNFNYEACRNLYRQYRQLQSYRGADTYRDDRESLSTVKGLPRDVLRPGLMCEPRTPARRFACFRVPSLPLEYFNNKSLQTPTRCYKNLSLNYH